MSEENKRLSDYDNSGQLGVIEMFGAIIFMLLGRMKKDYKYYYQSKFQKRNIWVGYFFCAIILTMVIVFGIVIPSIK